MTENSKAQVLRALHVRGAPLVLYNIWDAGSATAVAAAGSRAIATGSWSVAAAQGFADGEALPMRLLFEIAERIVRAVDLPVTVDFEGGYASAPEQVASNVAELAGTGAVGLNFEDQQIGGTGLYTIHQQTARLRAVRDAAPDMVINARTDVFLKEKDPSKHMALVDEAVARGKAYAGAGADSFFVPGLTDLELIAQICTRSPLPVNVMHSGAASDIPLLAQAGVGRISHGPNPYRWAMGWLQEQAEAAVQQEN